MNKIFEEPKKNKLEKLECYKLDVTLEREDIFNIIDFYSDNNISNIILTNNDEWEEKLNIMFKDLVDWYPYIKNNKEYLDSYFIDNLIFNVNNQGVILNFDLNKSLVYVVKDLTERDDYKSSLLNLEDSLKKNKIVSK